MTGWRWLLFGRRHARDLSREMQAHIDERVDALVDDGVQPMEARRRARAEFGNMALQVERSREVWLGRALDNLRQDLSYAVRTLIRQPGFSLGATSILAFAMGLVMVFVTAMNATILRPWPVPDPNEIVMLRANPIAGQQYGTLSAPEFRYLRAHNKSFTDLAAWLAGGLNLRAGDALGYAGVRYVTSNYFDALKSVPARGRLFRPADEDYASPQNVAVVSSQLAERLFGEGVDPIGRSVQIEGKPFTIIGVIASSTPRFGIDAWLPLPSIGIVQTTRGFDSVETGFSTGTFGRLQDGVSAEQAKAELDTLGQQFRQSIGKSSSGFALHGTRAIDEGISSFQRQMPVVAALFVGLLLVLLLACANVGNLLLARGLSRRREIAIRLSLGVSRWRMMRQLLAEAVTLAGVAGVLGLGIGWFVPIVTLRLVPGIVGFDAMRFSPDSVTVGAAIALAALATIIAGLAPALRLSKANLAERAGNRHGYDRKAGRLRTTFLAAQIALSMTLLVPAGLLTRAAGKALAYDPGFAIHEVQRLTFQIPGANRERYRTFMRTLDNTLNTSSIAPHAFAEFSAISGAFRLGTASRMDGDTQVSREVVFRNVSPTYFSTIGLQSFVVVPQTPRSRPKSWLTRPRPRPFGTKATLSANACSLATAPSDRTL